MSKGQRRVNRLGGMMSGCARRGRGGWLVLLPLAVLIGCEDVGLPGRNTPEEEAARREWRYDVYDEGVTPAGTAEAMIHDAAAPAPQTGAAQQPMEMGRHYVPTTETMRIPQHLLRPVTGMGGTPLFALATDRAPYHRLFAAAADRPLREGGAQAYHVMLRVPPPATHHEAGAADEHDGGSMDHSNR
jgi:hypothetical protein